MTDTIQLDDVTAIADRLCEYAPRMWENEAKAAELIKAELAQRDVPVTEQPYDVVYPTFPEYGLTVDGEQIECLPSGLRNGRITEKTVIDAFHVSGSNFGQPNINFNPACSGLSKPTFYNAPALSVARQDIPTILEADEIDGHLAVDAEQFTSRNFLIGSTDDPELIVFTHYDSWWGGFLDNAFSVATLLELAPHLDLSRVLIVVAGSEEFSNEDTYWCYGYRQFETAHHDLIQQADRIAVMDTIGRGTTQVNTDKDLLHEALVLNGSDYIDKTELLIGQFDRLMEVYHSPLDTRDALTHGEDALETAMNYFEPWMS